MEVLLNLPGSRMIYGYLEGRREESLHNDT
jgi:hypothetical protein